MVNELPVMLHYGKEGLPFRARAPWELTEFRKRPMEPLPDVERSLAAALESPVKAPPLKEQARDCRTACVLICDVTRPVPNGTLLPILIRGLLDAGLSAENITVLIATGLHRPNIGRELEELVGDAWVLNTVRVENHFARRDADHIDLGVTDRGVHVLLDRRFVEADLKLVTGLVEPHFMAGYSGGRKVIVPGIAHERTIRRIHAADYLRDERATVCSLSSNPLHRAQLAIVRQLGQVRAVNVVLDEHRRVCFVNYGALEPSHSQAVAMFAEHAVIDTPHRFRTVVTSAGGYPLDSTYYQTVKAMVGAMHILQPGGHIFVASSCSEGLGSPEYRAAQSRLVTGGHELFLEEISARNRAEIDEWQTQMQLRATTLGAVSLYSDGLSAEERALTGVHLVDHLEDAVAAWVDDISDPHIAVIPEGPYVVPRSEGTVKYFNSLVNS